MATTEQKRPHKHADDHTHDHHDDHHEAHGHTHGLVDPSIVRSKQGVKAVSLSLAVLLVASILQFVMYRLSHSVALLTDVIHNAGDAMTALPLGLAFFFQSKKGERWAGYCVVGVILISAIIALYQVVEKFIHPHTPSHLVWLFIAGVIGVIGNELAAVIRWRAGKRLDSPALIADGNHAKADGFVSAGIMVSTILIAVGLPIADPIVGLVITALILQSTWQSWQTIRSS